MSINPQAFISSYSPRLRAYPNPLLTTVVPPVTTHTTSSSRTTKRGTVAINYAENEYDDEDFEDSEGPRRLTGLRSRREDPLQAKDGVSQKTKDLGRPVEVQGIWRDWMGKAKVVRCENIFMHMTIGIMLISTSFTEQTNKFMPRRLYR
jgi:chromatin structure-remodeling complex subunit SFH1